MPHLRLARVALIALALLAALLPQRSPARSQDVFHLLKDLDTDTQADVRHATEAITMGGMTYFMASDGNRKYELWRTDGTASGTAVVMDFPDYLHYNAFQMIPAIDRFYFLTDSFEEYNIFLWVSDGTTEGTHIVLDSETGKPIPFASAIQGDPELPSILPFTTIKNTLFIASDNRTLWQTDGTTAGTTKFPLQLSFVSLISNNRNLYIVDDNNDLWVSDGTTAETKKLSQIMIYYDPVFRNAVAPYTTYTDKLFYFRQDNYSSPMELWETNGTIEGAKKIIVLTSQQVGPSIIASPSGIWINLPTYPNPQLWKSDGTAAGTIPITTLPYNMNNDLAFLDGKLYFILLSAGGTDLWASGGTAGSTAKVATLSATPQNTQLRQVGRKLIMCGLKTVECWSSDGTATGTTAITSAGTRLKLPIAAQLGSTLIAPAGGTSAKGLIWKSDGTATGTKAITSITMGVGTVTWDAQRVGGSTYFVSNAQDIWKSDGTAAGTTPQSELSAKIPSGARLEQLLSVNGKLIIATSTSLLASDGTGSGTTVIKDVATSSYRYKVFGKLLLISDGTRAGTIALPTDGGLIGSITHYGAQMLFTSTKDGEIALWKTDGSAVGTLPILKLPTTSATNIVVQGAKIFWIDPIGSQIELWTYNAQTNKAEHLTDITPTITTRITYIQPTDSRLIIFVESLNEDEIWASDGTPTGTIKLAKTKLKSLEHVSAGNLVFFVGMDTTHGNELWRTDGTVAGTFMVKDINPGPPSSYPEYFNVVGNTLYFRAYSPTIGVELWRSDGTAEGTALYADIAPGPYSSNVRPDLGNFGTELWVEASTPQYGTEPYIVNINKGSEQLYLPLTTAQ